MASNILNEFSKDELIELIEIYSKNWLAHDGLWFQSVEKNCGMKEAMKHNVAAWEKFTVIEAKKIKKFLKLEEKPGLLGLESALRCRFYAHINEDSIKIVGNTLTYTVANCRVQTARKRKGLGFHPCKTVGIVEYGLFGEAIDDRLKCECLSCFPEVNDNTCCCAWKYTLLEDEEK